MKSNIMKKNRLIYIMLILIIIWILPCNEVSAQHSSLGLFQNFILPPEMNDILSSGISIPIYLVAQNKLKKFEIGSVVLRLQKQKLKLLSIQLNSDGKKLISTDMQRQLSLIKNHIIDNNFIININKKEKLSIDLSTMDVVLTLLATSYQTSIKPRSHYLASSSIDDVSGSLQYYAGHYFNINRNLNNQSSGYLNFNSVTALREHHFILNGNVDEYNNGNLSSKINQAVYEHDQDGYRLALGMLQNSSMQTLGSVNAIGNGKLYGISYGNQSNTVQYNQSLSLIPIVVFLSSPGEVRIYRNNQLINIQNASMGNYEVDTSVLPYGNYPITVDVVSNGKVISHEMANINKPFSRLHSKFDYFSWQLWGGVLLPDNQTDNQTDNQENNTYFMGLSYAYSLLPPKKINLSGSIYAFEKTMVLENTFDVSPNDYFSSSLQSLLATDGSWSLSESNNVSLYDGIIEIWNGYQNSHYQRELRKQDMSESNTFYIGTTLELSKLVPLNASINSSYYYDNTEKYGYFNADYYQTIYNGKFGNVIMRLGINKDMSGWDEHYNKYINLTLSMPLSQQWDFSSSWEGKQLTGTLAYQRNLKDQFFSTVGGSFSSPLSEVNHRSVAAHAFADFNNQYISGHINTDVSNRNFNLSTSVQGSIGWQKNDLAISGENNGDSGLIINTSGMDLPFIAKVDGQMWKLHGDRNFIPLTSYQSHEVELMNGLQSRQTVTFSDNRKKHWVLYPGNIAYYKPQLHELVTIFGKIADINKAIIAGAVLKSSQDQTTLDAQGEFTIDVDKAIPTLVLLDKNKALCTINLNIQDKAGAAWLGELNCHHKVTYHG